jgi:hypothetical protein
MRRFQGPLEMFWLWVPGRGPAHMLSGLMRGPRLDGEVITVLVLDFVLVNRSNFCDSMHFSNGGRDFFAADSADDCHPS